ncbi:peptidoglycan DD-metalloendopeptidase family protein [uncultured Bartonella sp.]|uniref:murein hydrolase activator EnvC family protein n=1 Tax=uncultured Bartonella sp. TaxID=104108 RepID=UPI002624B7E3|nr:peptidoglycan DD-metalloendopeptidase family protein [uncultured Bartonella sp.]
MVLCILILSSSPCFSEDNKNRDAATKALSDIRQTMTLSQQKVSELASQVDSLKKDQRTLTSELVNAAKSEREVAEKIAASEEKLKKLLDDKLKIGKNLESRRGEFSEVLAALERMGLNPPPAILIEPDDALKSVRSAAVLGTLVPEMREKTLALSASLKELTNVEQAIVSERDQMRNQVQLQAEQQKRLTLLLEEKAKLQKTSEEELSSQRTAIFALAEKAKSLEDLLSELERQSRQQEARAPLPRQDSELLRNLDFEGKKNSLLLPTSGKIIQKFGSNNGAVLGDTIETMPGAIVTAPVDSVVAYAGAFRSYGQLVILDTGQNYHILLAGMDKINVVQGQFLLSGEPLGAMGNQQIASATSLDIGKSAPMLYIEFRKQGKPVNPAPWWVAGKSGRNQNDS